VASLSQGRTAAAQCGLFTHKSVPVIFEPPCILLLNFRDKILEVFLIYLSSSSPDNFIFPLERTVKMTRMTSYHTFRVQ